jgi:hypothetical protein
MPLRDDAIDDCSHQLLTKWAEILVFLMAWMLLGGAAFF